MKLITSPVFAVLASETAAYKLRNADLSKAPSLAKAKMSIEVFKASEKEVSEKPEFYATTAKTVIEPEGSGYNGEAEKDLPDCEPGFIRHQDFGKSPVCVEDPEEGPWSILLGVRSHGLDTIKDHKNFLCRKTQDLFELANNHPEVESQLVGHWTNNNGYVWKNHPHEEFSFHTREDGNIRQSYYLITCTGKRKDCLSIGENGEFDKLIRNDCGGYKPRAPRVVTEPPSLWSVLADKFEAVRNNVPEVASDGFVEELVELEEFQTQEDSEEYDYSDYHYYDQGKKSTDK